MTRYQKILVIATHCIGDSLLLTVFTRSLRRAYPEAIIDVLVTKRGKMVFETNPDVNHVVEIPRRPKVGDYLSILKQHGRYDLVVNEMLNDRSAIYSFVFGKNRLGAIDSKLKGYWFKKWIYGMHIHERGTFEHKMSRIARMLDQIGVDIEPTIVSPEATLPQDIVSQLPSQYVVVHTPSSNTIKQWPVEYWASLISKLLEEQYHVVLTGANSERDNSIVNDVVNKITSSRANLYNLVGRLSLAQTSYLLKHSQGFVGPDSGPGHMASGYSIPIVSIISVAPASVWSPWPYRFPVDRENNLYTNGESEQQTFGNVAVVQSTRQCVPCYKNTCQISDDFYSPCLQDIQPSQVMDVIATHIPVKQVS